YFRGLISYLLLSHACMGLMSEKIDAEHIRFDRMFCVKCKREVPVFKTDSVEPVPFFSRM
ncbi:MAG TPA: hypothetical protein VK436_06780, partial [Methanocella sp.]|nr:hypothetical protein [Methanocella sp.]